jgi:DNA-binding GntR family transcriptional regulator
VINDAAANPEAANVLERHWHVVAALWNRYGYGEKRIAGVISDHRQMIEALIAHDAEVAACLATAHAAKAKQALIARMLASQSLPAAAEAPGRTR